MKCNTCRCELTQEETDQATQPDADQVTICRECADFLNIAPAIAHNFVESVRVSFAGECLAANLKARAVVRRTTCGRLAIIRTSPRPDGTFDLLDTFASLEGARRQLASLS